MFLLTEGTELSAQIFKDAHSKSAEKGLEWEASYISESFANISGGLEQGANLKGLFNVSAELDLDKLIGLNNTQFGWNMMHMHGNSISDKVGDALAVSNIDAYTGFRFQNLWIQQTLFEEKLILRFGKQSIDDEFYSSDLNTLFLHPAAAYPFTLTGQAPQWPVGSLGLLIKYMHSDSWSFYTGMYGSDGRLLDDNLNNNGLKFYPRPSGHVIISEARFKKNDHFVRLGIMHERNEFIDFSGELKSGLTAIHVMYDTKLMSTGVNAKAGVYGGISLSTTLQTGRAPIDYDLKLNLSWEHTMSDDKIGSLGLTYLYPHVGKAANLNAPMEVNTEHITELTYRFIPNDSYELQSSIQYVANPSGGLGLDIHNALVLGIRLTIAI